MTTETSSNRAAHSVYAVIVKKAGGAKGSWLEIGAAWPRRQGYGVKLDVVPRLLDPHWSSALSSLVPGAAAGRPSFRFCRNENAVCRNIGDPCWIRTSCPRLRSLPTITTLQL